MDKFKKSIQKAKKQQQKQSAVDLHEKMHQEGLPSNLPSWSEHLASQAELNRAKARTLNKLCDILDEMPNSELGKAFGEKLLKDINT